LTPKNPADVAADLKCPVLALYGGADQFITPEVVEKRQAACKAAGKTCESKVYPDTPHGFYADYRPSYRAEQAKEVGPRCSPGSRSMAPPEPQGGAPSAPSIDGSASPP